MARGSARRHTCLRLWSSTVVWLATGGFALGAKQGDRTLEVLEDVERLVDAREAQVRDLVELTERAEDGEPDLVGVDLGLALLADALLDPLGEEGEVVLSDRAALAGLADADKDLAAAERLARAGALGDRQARRLDGGETAPALRALATPADRAAVVGGARVHHAGVGVPAERTVHGGAP